MITLVVGTRPNFIKISSIINSIKQIQPCIPFRLVHTGQHYDKSMSEDFFKQLQIPNPDINLNCASNGELSQISDIIKAFEKELNKNRPKIVVVVGDVNSTMACALTAKKLQIKVAHIEAGLRSYDRTMPEEINRVITDSISDYFFTTSIFANNNLLKENIIKDNIFFVGNTMIDSLKTNLNNLKCPIFFNENFLEKKKYFLMTLHRPSNVDDKNQLNQILSAVDNSSQKLPIIFPIHPRTEKIFIDLKNQYKNILVVKPQKYLEFIYLIKHSLGVITDSGGISEETTYLNIPCLTLRSSTERPETIYYGTNKLINNNFNLINIYINDIINSRWKTSSIPPLWDGFSSNRIINYLRDLI